MSFWRSAPQRGPIVQDLPEFPASQDGRGRVRDEARERPVPVRHREHGARGIDDAKLEPEIDDDGRAAGIVDVDVLEVAEVAAQRHVLVARPRKHLREMHVQPRLAEGLHQLAEVRDENGLLLFDLHRHGAVQEHGERQGEHAGGEPDDELSDVR